VETFWHDIRYGFRTLKKSPAFTAVAVITLALGIGANTAIFSVIEAALLRKLPYADPQHLVLLWGDSATRGDRRNQVSFTDVEDWRHGTTAFEDIAAYGRWSAILSGDGFAQRVPAIQVSDAFFRVLQAKPLLGRLLLPEDQVDGKDQVVVIANDLWRTRFGSDPNVVGRNVRINATSYVVVGVLAKDFHSLPLSLVDGQTEIYRPAAETYDEHERSSRHFRAIARLKTGATLDQAQAQMSTVAGQLAQSHPRDNGGYGVRATTMREDLVGNVRPALLLLYAAVVLVLLIACANVANLLLARSGVREKEIALRAALGASRSRLVRQLITESILLSMAGAGGGLLIASVIVAGARMLASQSLPAMNDVAISPAVLGFTVAIALLAAWGFGLLPALYGAKPDLVSSLKVSGTTTAMAGRRLLRDGLVVGEVAVALALLIGAGLLIRSIRHLSSVDPGFIAANVVAGDIALPYSKYGATPATIRFYDRLREKIQAQPGVQVTGLVSTLPFADFDTVGFEVEGQPSPSGPSPQADRYVVSPDYLRSMRIALKTGRQFTQEDSEGVPPVVLVNETLARDIWPGEDAIGKRIRMPGPENQPWRKVVGIVADIKQYTLDHAPTPQLYLPYRQYPANYMTLTARTNLPASSLAAAIREEAKMIDADAAISEPVALSEILSESIAERKFTMIMLLGFAILAAILAAVGIYGVLSYLVASRTREIGVRVALGARPQQILAMIMARGSVLIAAGAVLGLGLALAASRLIASMLFEVKPHDAPTFLVVTLALGCIALLASYIPARRAARVDPMVALRYE
jgi:putative ABC transport system permease protein